MSKHPVHLDLERVIDACTWFCDRGPVFPPTRVRPFVDAAVDAAVDVQAVHRAYSRQPITNLASERRRRALEVIGEAGSDGMKLREIARAMVLDEKIVREVLVPLREVGVITVIGAAARSRWVLAEAA